MQRSIKFKIVFLLLLTGCVQTSTKGDSSEVIHNESPEAQYVTSGIRLNLSQILKCYEEGLKRKPTLQGIITTSFTIESTGHIRDTIVKKSDFSDITVQQCIVKRMNVWKFSPPLDGNKLKVTYPFKLSLGEKN